MFPEIITGKYLLRKIIAADQAKIYEGLSHPDIIKFYGVSYSTLESTRAQLQFYDDLLINESGIWWAICEKNNPAELIGACGFNDWNRQHKHIEIGFWLLPYKQGTGVMSECIPHIIQYAFNDLDIHRIVAVVEEGNENSSRLLTRLGFQFEGKHKECEIKNLQFISLDFFALLNTKK